MTKLITTWHPLGGSLTRRGRSSITSPAASTQGRVVFAEVSTTQSAFGQILAVQVQSGTGVTSVPISSFAQPGDNFQTAIARLTTPTIVDLEGNTWFGYDFNEGNNAYMVYNPNLLGVVNGTIEMVTDSSTHASAVNAQVAANSGTVQETILRLGGGAANPNVSPYFGATIQGTAQGHIYNGLEIYYSTNALIEGAQVYGIPGSNGAPPGETFPINNYRSVGTVLRNVVVDGLFQGSKVAASGFGNNYSTTISVYNSIFQNMGYGHGVTHYESSNPTYIGCTFQNNHSVGANFEKVTGTITMVNCVFNNNSHCMCVDTDGASAVVNIYDPQWETASGSTGDADSFEILRHTDYNYPPPDVDPNGQNISDFHIFMGGTWSGGAPGVGSYIGGTEVTGTYLKVVTN